MAALLVDALPLPRAVLCLVLAHAFDQPLARFILADPSASLCRSGARLPSTIRCFCRVRPLETFDACARSNARESDYETVSPLALVDEGLEAGEEAAAQEARTTESVEALEAASAGEAAKAAKVPTVAWGGGRRRGVVVHAGQVKRDRTSSVVHRRFDLDGFFDGCSTEEEVFSSCCGPILSSPRQRGTVILFGQTGTGKTHTVRHLQRRISGALDGERVTVKAFEVLGTSAYDLLGDRRPIALREYHNGVHVCGAVERVASK